MGLSGESGHDLYGECWLLCGSLALLLACFFSSYLLKPLKDFQVKPSQLYMILTEASQKSTDGCASHMPCGHFNESA